MVDDVQIFHVTAAVGTSAASPQVVNLAMPPRRIIGIEILIPDGARGSSGIALGAAGTRFIPSNANSYIISNDEIIRWPYVAGLDSGAWQAFVYNIGTFAHTYEVRFLCNLLTAPLKTSTNFISAQTLESG